LRNTWGYIARALKPGNHKEILYRVAQEEINELERKFVSKKINRR